MCPRTPGRLLRLSMPALCLGLLACDVLGVADKDTACTAPVCTYREGPMLYLQRKDGANTVRVGLDTRWGGVITELSLNGTNFVNSFDTGREIQLSIYDGNGAGDACAGCTGNWPWNAVQGGDLYRHGSPVLERQLADSSIYVKSHPLQWLPDNKGGGRNRPVQSDMLFETVVEVVPEHPLAFRLRYVATHTGSDEHAATTQEVPAVFADARLANFAHYAGAAPWTGEAVTLSRMRDVHDPAWVSSYFHIPERWGAFVDDQGVGLTVFVPSAYPYALGYFVPGSTGPYGYGAQYFHAKTVFGVGPGARIAGEVYLIAGDYREARKVVYDLNARLTPRDISSPWGALTLPQPGAQVAGSVDVSGWAIDDVGVSSVEVLVDGSDAGRAEYGTASPPAVAQFPGASPNAGFVYRLDTTRYANGPHTLTVRMTDAAGNVLTRRATINVGN